VSARRAALVLACVAIAACSRRPAPKPSAEASPAPAPAPAPAAPAPRYEAQLGHDVFAHYCATCHGDTGAGDGFNAYNLDPHPRDLSDPAFQKTKSDAQLADTVRRGGAGVGLSSLMPPWGRTLTERQVTEVVQYVRSLKKTAP
jgi:mono/diheme cytochrome c family protein